MFLGVWCCVVWLFVVLFVSFGVILLMFMVCCVSIFCCFFWLVFLWFMVLLMMCICCWCFFCVFFLWVSFKVILVILMMFMMVGFMWWVIVMVFFFFGEVWLIWLYDSGLVYFFLIGLGLSVLLSVIGLCLILWFCCILSCFLCSVLVVGMSISLSWF